MGEVLVLGGGPIGLATAMLFAREGHEVTVLERDPDPPPRTGLEACETWRRTGVAQFRQVHTIHARFRQILEAEFPDVLREIERSGGRKLSFLGAMPTTVEDRSPRPGDERFDVLSARRPVVESAFARLADETPGVTVRRGVVVEGLKEGVQKSGVPHVVGVSTKDGESLTADLVVDAMGRRSKFPEWVEAIGARPPIEEATDTGFAYYTRHYRWPDGQAPGFEGPPSANLSTLMVIGLPVDNDTAAVAVVCQAGDKALKELRKNEVFEKVVGSVPRIAHWIDAEPVHDVLPMAGALDRYRRFAPDGQPVVTGLIAVGDSWACTNPTAGRGLSLGIAHAVALRDLARDAFDEPLRLAVEFDAITEEAFTPWYRQQIDRDRARVAAVEAAIEGRDPPKADPSDRTARMQEAFMIAAAYDPEVARGFLDVMAVLALPQHVMARPGMIDKVMASSSDRKLPVEAGPNRQELLELMGSV
jgi:2-polyprenyl-6-methoxyphenol hydroxylase-like FAD-dependent oxidoreductase